MKKIIISACTLFMVACGANESDLKIYSDQKAAVEKQIKDVQNALDDYTKCKGLHPDSCDQLKEKLVMENSYLTTEIDALSKYVSEGAIKEGEPEVLKFRDANNKFAEQIK